MRIAVLLVALVCALLLSAAPVLGRKRQQATTRRHVSIGKQPQAAGPRIYISFHGGGKGSDVNNVWSFSLTGELLSQAVLEGDAVAQGLRSLLLFTDGSMLASNANKDDSRIAQYSPCGADGTRKYMGDFATIGLAHSYGLALGSVPQGNESVVWASNQDTADIAQFSLSGQYEGQLHQFADGEELRSLAFNDQTGVLYVADETQNAVLAYDSRAQVWNSSLSFSVTDPVGLYLDAPRQLLYVGSNDAPSAVFAYDVSASAAGLGRLTQTFKDRGLSHPAGLLVVDAAAGSPTLLALSQDTNTLLAFDAATGAFIRVVIDADQFDDTVEQIMLSPC